MATIVKGTKLCISANGRKRHLKDVSVTGDPAALTTNCEGHISYVGGSGTVTRFLLWDARLMADVLRQKSKGADW